VTPSLESRVNTLLCRIETIGKQPSRATAVVSVELDLIFGGQRSVEQHSPYPAPTLARRFFIRPDPLASFEFNSSHHVPFSADFQELAAELAPTPILLLTMPSGAG
jgi:hypothetical protein